MSGTESNALPSSPRSAGRSPGSGRPRWSPAAPRPSPGPSRRWSARSSLMVRVVRVDVRVVPVLVRLVRVVVGVEL